MASASTPVCLFASCRLQLSEHEWAREKTHVPTGIYRLIQEHRPPLTDLSFTINHLHSTVPPSYLNLANSLDFLFLQWLIICDDNYNECIHLVLYDAMYKSESYNNDVRRTKEFQKEQRNFALNIAVSFYLKRCFVNNNVQVQKSSC